MWRVADGSLKVCNGQIGACHNRHNGIEIAGVVISVAGACRFELSLVLHGIAYKYQVGFVVSEDERSYGCEQRDKP